jgi:DNA-binding response OmpR family regulator
MQPHILIVDDTPYWSRLLATPLLTAGFAIESARDAMAALAAIRQTPPALILLAAMRDTEEAIANCQMIRRVSHIPIIILSARADDPRLISALETGADDYLTMPFAPRELVARIRAVLRPFAALPPTSSSSGCGAPSSTRSPARLRESATNGLA